MFENYSDEQGLNTGPVKYIYQDRIGYIWIAGSGGLFRYDGYEFKHYPTSIGTLNIIYQDKSGILWIGASRGLAKLDPATGQITYYKPHSQGPKTEWSNNILSILDDKKGTLWIGTAEGLNIFDRRTLKFTTIYHDSSDSGSLSNNIVFTIYEDEEERVWFGTANGLNLYERSTKKFKHYFYDPNLNIDFASWNYTEGFIISIYEDSENILWLGTFVGLIKFNPSINKYNIFKHEPNNPNSLGHNHICSVTEDQLGTLWIATDGYGVDTYERSTNLFKHHINRENDPTSIASNFTNSVLAERSGSIWAGNDLGAAKLNRAKQPFSKIMDGYVLLITNAKNGNMHIAFQKDSKIYNLNTSKISTTNENLMWTDDDGTMWFYKFPGNLYSRDSLGKIKTFYYSKGKVFNSAVTAIYRDRQGIVWIGTGGAMDFFILMS
ncbi:MAG: two-component regulator propeller domain-containing protein [Ignavibacteriaceae bacterium]